MFLAKKYLNNIFLSESSNSNSFWNYSMIKPPGTPLKSYFFEKKNVDIAAIFNPKTLIFEYVTQNNHRKHLAKTGWRILIGSIFGIFSSKKMAISRPFLGQECRFLPWFIVLIWRTFLPNFMTITWNGLIFRNFCHTKNRSYLGNYNR